MKRILVSGAGGFLGIELIKQLLQNEDVYTIALSRQKDRLEKLFGTYKNFNLTSEFPQNVDVFINCVFPANANGMQLAEGLDYITDLYMAAKKQAVGSVINVSTQRVYSQTKARAATELTVPDLGTKYSVGKYAVEKLTNTIFCDMPHTNIRMASLIGPNSDGRISNRFVKQVIAGEDIHIVADTQDFGFLDVRDAAEAIAKYALMTQEKWEEVLNLGSGKVYSLQDVAECVTRVGEEFGYHSSVIVGEETGDVRNSAVDGNEFKILTGWQAEITLEETMRDAYRFYLEEKERAL